MADQAWIQDMSDAVDAAEQQALQETAAAEDAATQLAFQQSRVHQEEVPTEPATSPRHLDPEVQERPAFHVQQPVPPPRAHRPDYQAPTEAQRWSRPPTYYYIEPDTTRTGDDYHQDREQAHYAHLEAEARIERWDRQRREQAERENREHE